MTIHLFISQALVSASMYSRIKAGGAPETQSITYPALLSQVSFLSQLFRGEFIFPTAGLARNLAHTLAGLEADGVIKVTRRNQASYQPSSNSQQPSQPQADDILSIDLSDAERHSGRENFDFYCFLIWPFIEASWLGAISLLMLTPPTSHTANATINGSSAPAWLDARTVQSSAQLLGKTLYAQGDLSYFEAVNKETLKNAYTRFEEEGVIVIKTPPKDKKGAIPQVIRLTDEWMPQRDEVGNLKSEGRLWEFCEEVSRCRAEGKNRRDGDAAVGRVLRLVEEVGRRVWEGSGVVRVEEVRNDKEEEELKVEKDVKVERKEKRRRAPLRTKASL